MLRILPMAILGLSTYAVQAEDHWAYKAPNSVEVSTKHHLVDALLNNHLDLATLGFLTVGPLVNHEEMMDNHVDVMTRGWLPFFTVSLELTITQCERPNP
jgi:hypothetical protein